VITRYTVVHSPELSPYAESLSEQAAKYANVDAVHAENVKLRAEAEALRAEVERLKAAQTWQPIETAPMDRRVLLLLPSTYNTRVVTGEWVDAPRGTNDPTHWMPLAEAIHPDTVWHIPQRLAVAIALDEHQHPRRHE
jgi:hypothetical protein